MSLYPSLEDMKVHKLVTAQHNAFASQSNAHSVPSSCVPHEFPHSNESSTPSAPVESADLAIDEKSHAAVAVAEPTLYPGLNDFMGLELSKEIVALNMPEYVRNIETAIVPSSNGMIAPLSSQSVGLQRAQVTHGIREVIVCKGTDNKIGLRVKDINNGIFISLVCKDSPAALVG